MRLLDTLATAMSLVMPLCVSIAPRAGAQSARDTVKTVDAPATRDTARVAADTTPRGAWGDINPGQGVELFRSSLGMVRLSAYGLARYLNQLPGRQPYTDHLGRPREADPRQDIQWHRVMVHVMGWMYLPKLNYVMTVWTVNATEQVRLVGSLTYAFDKAFNLSAGINGIPGTRSLNGSHPLWLAPDRVMADEYFRPGFTSGAWATGVLPWRFNYSAMIGNNISQLGVSAAELTRDLAGGASVWWLPTTGEFGPKGGYGDYDWHKRVAVRVGSSFTRSREDRASQIGVSAPDNTQIRISDGVLLFETGALADNVTVQQANYAMSAVDLGLKYRGIFLQTEIYHRWLDRFNTDGPVPVASLYDKGFYIAGAFYPMPRRLELYSATSQIYGAFNRSWEVLGGANWYPAPTRYFRVNAHVIRVHRSPAGSSFGYYNAGLDGTTLSLASYVLF